VVDVLVVGGGPAGIVAAMSAARNGASTVLIEQRKFLGGVAALGVPFQGFHDDRERLIVGGLPWEIMQRLIADGVALPPWFLTNIIRAGGSTIIHDPHRLRQSLWSLVLAAGVEVRLSTQSVDVSASVVIDATGNGDVAVRAGASYQSGNASGQCQPASMLYRVGNVNMSDLLQTVDAQSELYGIVGPSDCWSIYQAGVRFGLNGPLVCGRESNFLCFPKWGELLLTIMVPNEQAWDVGAIQTHERFTEIQSALPCFRYARLLEIMPAVGVRESRRICGMSTLRIDDMANGRLPTDCIGLGGRGVDINDPTPDGSQPCRMMHRSFSRPYGISFGCLIPRGVPNMLLAGRCLSADYEAFGSVRVMAQMMTTGQAAGTAAAMAVEQSCDVRQLPIVQLQERLREQRAILQ